MHLCVWHDNKYSCFTNDSLIKIAKSFNNHYSDRQKIIIPNKLDESNREIFWKELEKNLNNATKCDNEICWLDKHVIKKINDNNIEKSFRPEKPHAWYQNKKD